MSTLSSPESGLPPITLARRSQRMNPSVIREILKVTERPGILSLAGGLPAAELFPIDAIRAATDRVLSRQPREALQYAASEGHGPLREWIAATARTAGIDCDPDQVLVTTGSQQGLDLVAKLLVDAGSIVRVESPTYLGALQAFAPFEPVIESLPGDDEGPAVAALAALPRRAALAGPDTPRFAYLVPNFQNPSGRTITAARRREIAAALEAGAPPLVEDNPYGELWFDAPPPPPIASLAPARTLYLGSLSKVLSPGLRLGYVIAPRALYPKLLQAKQAADLHTSGFTQRIAAEALAADVLTDHLPAIRRHYRARRDAMEAALQRHLGDIARWVTPGGGMFYWLTLNGPVDALAMLPDAVDAGVAYVPGAAFFGDDDPTPASVRVASLRLSFVTVTPAAIETAIAALAGVIRRHAERARRAA